jgi:predicted ATPase
MEQICCNAESALIWAKFEIKNHARKVFSRLRFGGHQALLLSIAAKLFQMEQICCNAESGS